MEPRKRGAALRSLYELTRRDFEWKTDDTKKCMAKAREEGKRRPELFDAIYSFHSTLPGYARPFNNVMRAIRKAFIEAQKEDQCIKTK